jgi:photosystem II stability/assembly factor-like uncharacterized protein/subtilisin-like proprotein convertase family protein
VVLLLTFLLGMPQQALSNSGIFLPYVSYPVGAKPRAVAAGDVNNDGRVDVVVVREGEYLSTADDEVLVFLQDGEGGLATPTRLSAGAFPRSAAIGDVNGDGLQDVVVGAQSGLGVYLQSVDGTLLPMLEYRGIVCVSVAIGDLNGDGRQDIVVAADDGTYLFLQLPDGTLGLPALLPTGRALNAVRVADLNGDGYPDVVGLYAPLRIVVIHYQTAEGLSSAYEYPGPESDYPATALAVGDVNHDGLSDVLVTYGAGSTDSFIAVFLQSISGALTIPVWMPTPDSPVGVDVADVNGDGRSDVLVGARYAIGVLPQTEIGQFLPFEQYSLTTYRPDDHHELVARDVDGDGYPDVVILDNTTGLIVFRNAGGSQTTYPLSIVRAGSGVGSVVSTQPSIVCGTFCERRFLGGSVITLYASPASGSVFSGWNDVPSTLQSYTFTMDRARTVTARFDLAAQLSVVLTGLGQGGVTSPSFIGSCHNSGCVKELVLGSTVTLTASPVTGSFFTGWGGACAGTGTCTITLSSATTVTATFEAGAWLGVSKPVLGSTYGMVWSTPSGVNCGSTCSKTFPLGTAVTLTASPLAGYAFDSWGGACAGQSTPTCELVMDEDRSLYATFVEDVTDPSWSNEWHLNPFVTDSPGVNATTAWGTTRGAGVVVAVMDDGLQYTHPDLQPNYLSSLSWDFFGNDPDPAPTTGGNCETTADCHGTAVAGVVAARGGNEIGVRGVAPEASLAGIRLTAGYVADARVAEALTFKLDEIHVANLSWGFTDPLEDLEPLSKAALETAVRQGRGGKGRIFVKAGGNDGDEGGNCNFEGVTANRHVIAVGAFASDGQQAYYSTPCAALLVTAPSNGGARSITTTDLQGSAGYTTTGLTLDYTSYFGGTSASTPIVSGVVAMMLARNPGLTWRDVKHILVRTAIRVDATDPGWSVGTFPHNEKYGFGLVDAGAAVGLAAAWPPVGPEVAIEPSTRAVGLTVPDNNPTGLADTITIGGEHAGLQVEHVDVVFSATHPRRSDLDITLTSPSGVVSRLAPASPVNAGANYTAWRLGSVRHWGESPVGAWTLHVSDRKGSYTGKWTSWALKVYATAVRPASLTSPTPGSVIPGDTATFTWSAADPPANYRLEVGSTPGGSDLYAGDLGRTYSTAVGGLPIDGRTLYVRLHWQSGGTESSADYTFTATTIPLFPVNVAVEGPGSIASAPSGIQCGESCLRSFRSGTIVTLTATPNAGARFRGWGGACNGTGDCQLVMDAAKSVTAEFEAVYSLTIAGLTGTPPGRVVGPGIDCGSGGPGDCIGMYPVGSVVTLSALPVAAYRVRGWTGCDTVGADFLSCVVTLGAPREIGISFDPVGEHRWEAVGPSAGEVTALVVDPTNSSRVYAATEGGGVFVSANGGLDWRPARKGLRNGSVQALAIDRATPTTLYAAAKWSGAYKTTDAGASWTSLSVGSDGELVWALAVDPVTSSTVYAGTSRGLYKSANGGTTWQKVDGFDVKVLVVDPTRPSTLFAGGANGIRKSTNGGTTWRAVNSGLITFGVQALVLDPTIPSTLYAGTEVGVFRSLDGGNSWAACSLGLPSDAIRGLALDPAAPAVLYAATRNGGIFKSTDGGESWLPTSEVAAGAQVRVLAADPSAPAALYASAGTAGLFKSLDGGLSWMESSRGLTYAAIQALAVHPVIPSTIYAGGTSVRGPVFKSVDGAESWKETAVGLSGAGKIWGLAFDPTDLEKLYAGTEGRGIYRSFDGGVNWQEIYQPIDTGNVWKLVVDPTTPTTLYAGTSVGLIKLINGGNTRTVNLSGLSIHAVSLDPSASTTLYAGGYKSTDGGATWTAGAGLGSGSVEVIVVDPTTPTTLYAGTGGGVLKSSDGGANWAAVSNGLWSRYVTSLTFDPTTPTTLYAGTYSGGVFKTVDGGESWTAINLGLGSDHVTSLAVDPSKPTTLYAGTYDAGVYVLRQNSLPDVRLTVGRTGTGSGGVTSSPGGIVCAGLAPDCTEIYPAGTEVILTAVPEGSSVFAGWSGGGCGGVENCVVTLDESRSVVAVFADSEAAGQRFLLSVSIEGRGAGTVTSLPAGIDCPGDCSEVRPAGTSVVLTASPATMSLFAGWSGGGCSGTGPCTVTLDRAARVTASFALQSFPLTVHVEGSGTGTVTSVPAGIACGADCLESFEYQTGVTLSAAPDAGSVFTGWSGACAGTWQCALWMGGAHSVTASFARVHSLTIPSPPLYGRITGSGIDCGGGGSDCSETVEVGSSIELSISIDPGAVLQGWAGCDSVSPDGMSCSVRMDGARVVGAEILPSRWVPIGPWGEWTEFLAIAPSNPATLYAGSSSGLYRTTDGGALWVGVDIGPGIRYTNVVVDPRNTETVYVGSSGGGVFKSTDGGLTWGASNTGLTDRYVTFLAIDPSTPTMLYAGAGARLFRSGDGGVSWEALGEVSGLSISTLAVDPSMPTTLYVSSGGSVHRSTDGGGSWASRNTGIAGGAYVHALVVDPRNPSVVYAGSSDGVYRSVNGGLSWVARNGGLASPGVVTLAFDPTAPAALYAGTEAGVFRSTDGGLRWTAVSVGLQKSLVTRLVIDPARPATLYAATASGIFRSTDRGDSWVPRTTGAVGVSVGAVGFGPASDGKLYAGSNGIYVSADGGASWTRRAKETLPNLNDLMVAVPTTPPTLFAGQGALHRSNDDGATWAQVQSGLMGLYVRTLVFDPAAPSVLYAGTDSGVFKSTDGGAAWVKSSAGLPDTPVYRLVLDSGNPATLYAGTGTGIYKSTDAGAHWASASAGLPSGSVHSLALDPVTPTTLYAATGGGGVYKSVDGAESWIRKIPGLLASITAIAADPDTPGTVYAGGCNPADIIVSRDGGQSWRPMRVGLRGSCVRALAFDNGTPRTLHAATYGAGLFVLSRPHLLSVNRDGVGSGSVSTSAPGIACGASCRVRYEPGTTVTLTATPAADSVVAGWGGCDSADGDSCTVSMTAAKRVVVSFDKLTYPLTVMNPGGGTVNSTPAGILCGSACTKAYLPGTKLTLTATPVSGFMFGGWSGACTNVTGACSVTMSGGREVVPIFKTTLAVVRMGTGSGGVVSEPAGISCGADCSEWYPVGSQVTLTATPVAGSAVTGWTGCDSADGNHCTVTVTAINRVVATIQKHSYPLSVGKRGTGAGTITGLPVGIACGATCTASYAHGTPVTLTATPAVGSQFVGWDGACTQASGPCVVAMDGAKEVGATFRLLPPGIATLAPAAGAVGVPVTITGSYFGGSLGTLTFAGDVPAPITAWTAASIRAVVPAGAQSGEMTLTTADGRTATKSYTAMAPALGAISPASAAVGSIVTLVGSNFGAAPGGVTFTGASGSVAAPVASGAWTNTAVRVAVPAGALGGPVAVTTADGRSVSRVFAVLLPSIGSLLPASAAVGMPVTIAGTNFGAAPGRVVFAGAVDPVGATVTRWTATSVTLTVPIGATSGPLTLTTADGKGASKPFSVPNPAVATLTPATGSVGVSFSITGSGLGALRGSVTFGGEREASITQWTDISVKGTIPAEAATGPVTLRTADGRIATRNYTAGTPALTSVAPATAAVGAQIALGGNHLGATPGTVRFTGVTEPILIPASAWSVSSVKVAVPAGALSGPVTLTTADGKTATRPFTVLLPAISYPAPASGAPGAAVTIVGTNFGTPAGGVTFEGTVGPVGAAVTAWTAGSVRVTVPVGAITGPLTLTTADGKTATKLFTVPDPTLTSISPATGAPGIPVAITGSRFGLIPGSVTFSGPAGPVAASLAPGTAWTDTAVKVLVPVAAVSGDLTLTRPDGKSVSRSFGVPDPTITSLSPLSGAAGTTVTISGNHFGLPAGSVAFAGNWTVPALSWTNSRVTIKVPAGLSTGQVSVTLTTAAGKTATRSFTVIASPPGSLPGGGIIIVPPTPPPPGASNPSNPAALPWGS